MNYIKVSETDGCTGCAYLSRNVRMCLAAPEEVSVCVKEKVIYVDPAKCLEQKCSAPDIQKCSTPDNAPSENSEMFGSNHFLGRAPEKRSAPDIPAPEKHHAEDSGAVYVKVPQLRGCVGCAFNSEEKGHCVAPVRYTNRCFSEKIIYVKPAKCSATDILASAKHHMDDRAATYDAPQGERSMEKTVEAFNALTGHKLTEVDGFLLMSMLKIVRDRQNGPHRDSLEDLVAYTALMAEARLK